MKKIHVLILAISITVSACFLTFVYLLGRSALYVSPREKVEEDLANQLGVNITDFPYVKVFPIGYFISVLKPGMSFNEVHGIVRGYEKVLRCDGYSEIYYYYSSIDSEALRFEIFYDSKEKYKDMKGEDTNSRTIRTNDCENGVIDPSN